MVAASSPSTDQTTGTSGIFKQEIQLVEATQQEVAAEVQSLSLAYRDRASLSVVGYVIKEVRQICTSRFPDQFLSLSLVDKTELMQKVRKLADALGKTVQQIPIALGQNPWSVLEDRFTPHLTAAEGDLQQFFVEIGIGANSQDPQSLLSLRLLDLELGDPQLRHLRSQLQVLTARLGRLEQQLQVLVQKQAVAQAEADWTSLWVSLQPG